MSVNSCLNLHASHSSWVIKLVILEESVDFLQYRLKGIQKGRHFLIQLFIGCTQLLQESISIWNQLQQIMTQALHQLAPKHFLPQCVQSSVQWILVADQTQHFATPNGWCTSQTEAHRPVNQNGLVYSCQLLLSLVELEHRNCNVLPRACIQQYKAPARATMCCSSGNESDRHCV